METALFWILWGIISYWVLKTFYYSFSKEKLERLRKSALGINLAVLILTFLPWVPSSLGGSSCVTLALQGNVLSVLFVILLLASILLSSVKDASLLKLASIVTIANTILLFILMYQLRPGTYTVTNYDIAPITAVLLLLVACVAGLLLWQQLNLKRRKK